MPQRKPHLTQARVPATCAVVATNHLGEQVPLALPAERDLTLYVDKRELVTLMTLGSHPEWLALGYLRNQQLVDHLDQIGSVTVDWSVGAAAVNTRQGLPDLAERTAHRVVTTGCGQGSVFAAAQDKVAPLAPGDQQGVKTSTLQAVVEAIRLHPSVYKTAGSVHGCALFRGTEMLLFVEDVGRHNAVDTIAGWMWLNGVPGAADLVFYTTGRLTSEMVMKAAHMGVPVLVSRSGMTQMGLDHAQRLGLCAVGRATHQRFLCYTHPERLVWDTSLP